MKDSAATYVEDESEEVNNSAEENSEEEGEAQDESAEDVEDGEEEETEGEDESAAEHADEYRYPYNDKSISGDSCDPEDYREDDLPNLNFPKFVIPRVPDSDFSSYVLKHIKNNAQPRTALKLMQICKYFCHEEFPFLPTDYIEYYEDYGFSYSTLQGQEVEYADYRLLKLFKKKLWMTYKINIDHTVSIKFFLRYIVACDLQELCIQCQSLSINQFKFLTFGGELKKLCFRSVSLNYENGDPVPLEEILKCMPNIEEFAFGRSSIYHENVTNFIPFLNPTKLNFFALGSLTENFDFETFITYITNYPKIQFSLQFEKSIPVKYFQKLQNFVEDIRKGGSYSKYVFSRIFCDGNRAWRYGCADEWYELPDIFCKCGWRQTLHSNFDPPYFLCRCDQYLMLKSPEAWNKEFSKYYERRS